MKADAIDCATVMERLWAFLDGELEAGQHEQVREHLHMCERCFPRYDFQRAYFRMMQKLAEEPLPPRIRRRVFQDLLNE
jgi:anti-sigma factor (TIGR02949 family)